MKGDDAAILTALKRRYKKNQDPKLKDFIDIHEDYLKASNKSKWLKVIPPELLILFVMIYLFR